MPQRVEGTEPLPLWREKGVSGKDIPTELRVTTETPRLRAWVILQVFSNQKWFCDEQNLTQTGASAPGGQTMKDSKDWSVSLLDPSQHSLPWRRSLRHPAHITPRSERIQLPFHGFMCPCLSWVEKLQFEMSYELLSRAQRCQSFSPGGCQRWDDAQPLFIYLWLLLISWAKRGSIDELQGKFVCIILSIPRSFL